MELKVIAYARNGHTDKFGIPRQSREESPIVTRIVFEPDYSVREALRGIEGFSHLWLLWGFDKGERLKLKGERGEWSPTVRPPRLGGNVRMGVFATRSPFRPNPIGLSSVKLLGVEEIEITRPRDHETTTERKALALVVSGADLMDGTPIYDIKPYLSFSDSHPEAKNGFAERTRDYRLEVDWGEFADAWYPNQGEHSRDCLENGSALSRDWLDDASFILSQDPRPAYQDDSTREYKLDYAGYTITFTVDGQTVHVKNIVKI